MKKRSLASCIVAVGLALALLVVYRSVSGGRAEVGISGNEDLRPEFVVRDKELGFVAYAASDTRSELFAAVRDRLPAGIDEQAARLAVERSDMLFDADYDTWKSYVAGAVSGEIGSWSTIREDRFREIWDASIAPYTNAKLDVDRVRVREIDPDRGFPSNQGGTIIVKSNANLTAPYRKLVSPSGPETREAIEVLVPVQVEDKAGSQMGATIAFVLGRDRPADKWRELEMFVYIGEDGFGRDIVLPPF